MKLNLPSTLTQEKMTGLFLLTFLHINGVKGGSQFSSCINSGPHNSDNLYNLVDYFANNVPDKQDFCCDVGGSGAQPCVNITENQCPFGT